jgi:hypothetical protein
MVGIKAGGCGATLARNTQCTVTCDARRDFLVSSNPARQNGVFTCSAQGVLTAATLQCRQCVE